MRALPAQAIHRLEETVEATMGDYLGLLERLVATPSHASIPDGTEAVARLLLPRLEALGFAMSTVAQDPLPSESAWIEKIMIPGQSQEDLGPTHVGTREGGSPARVLLLGDLDTAYPLERHEAFPIRREDALFFGPGIADMKGGLVVLVAALEALAAVGMELPSIDIVLAADEQAGSLGSRAVIKERAERCAWALCVECARQGGRLMAARGHIGIGDLTANGVEAHAGSAYSEGVNATDYLARVIPHVNALTRPDSGIFVTVTILEAGRRRSVIPDRAWGVLDIRTPSPADWDATVAELEEVVQEWGMGRVEARTYAHRPGVLWNEETDALLDLIRECGAPLGTAIEGFRSAAAGSTAFAGETGSIVMDGMGPLGGGLMTHDEHIDISSIPPRAGILAATIAGLGRVG